MPKTPFDPLINRHGSLLRKVADVGGPVPPTDTPEAFTALVRRVHQAVADIDPRYYTGADKLACALTCLDNALQAADRDRPVLLAQADTQLRAAERPLKNLLASHGSTNKRR